MLIWWNQILPAVKDIVFTHGYLQFYAVFGDCANTREYKFECRKGTGELSFAGNSRAPVPRRRQRILEQCYEGSS